MKCLKRIYNFLESAIRGLPSSHNRAIRYGIPIIMYSGMAAPFLFPKGIVYVFVVSALYLTIKTASLPVQQLSCLSTYLILTAISGIPLLEKNLIELAIKVERLLGLDVLISPSLLFSGSIMILVCSGSLGHIRIASIAVVLNILVFLIVLVSVQLYCKQAFISPDTFTIILIAIRAILEVWNFFWFLKLCKANINVMPPVATVAAIFLLVIVLPAMGTFDRVMLQHRGKSYEVVQNKTVGFWWPEASREEELGFHNTQGHYGIDAIGFWGELPVLLQRSGFRVLKTTCISMDTLAKCQVFCLLSPPRALTSSEISVLNEFVSVGGRLFITAEHTNLDRNMEIFNPLLKVYDISVNFDTTNGLFGDGLKGVKFGKHPLRKYISATPYLVHNRGASLNIGGHQAFPILTGRFWYGDAGNPLALDKAYLSNYQISYGDRIGELTLMAVWESKKGGKVFVTGDTSAFLNQNIGYNSLFITAVFDYLTSNISFRPYSMKVVLIYIASMLACIISFILLRSNRIRVSFALIGLVILVGTLEVFEPSLTTPPIPKPLAIISDSENNMVSRNPFSPFSSTGLLVTTTRLGFAPYFGDWRRLGITPDVLFIINPCKMVNKSQLENIAGSGSIVIISGGGDNETFVQTAKLFDINVIDPPLGSIQDDLLNTYSAWQVKSIASASPITVNNITIGISLPYKTGSITFIADKGFFYSKNLETSTNFDMNNQHFIQQLIAGKKLLQ